MTEKDYDKLLKIAEQQVRDVDVYMNNYMNNLIKMGLKVFFALMVLTIPIYSSIQELSNGDYTLFTILFIVDLILSIIIYKKWLKPFLHY